MLFSDILSFILPTISSDQQNNSQMMLLKLVKKCPSSAESPELFEKICRVNAKNI